MSFSPPRPKDAKNGWIFSKKFKLLYFAFLGALGVLVVQKIYQEAFMSNGRYSELLKSGGFQGFLWTQFLGAFNDNVSKWIITLYAMDMASGHGSVYAAAVGG